MNEKAIPDEFFTALQNIYEEDENLREYWASERAQLEEILPRIASKISFNYIIEKPLAVGGGGVVILVQDINLAATRVLKISRPSPGKERLLAGILHAETENLRRLSHQNLIRIFAQGAVEHDGADYPFYVMDYVVGASDANKYFIRPEITEAEVLNIVGGTLAAIGYLHEQDTIHLDIKPANILVTPAAIAIVSDLGFAKRLKNEEGMTLIGGTEGYIHPDARKFLTEISSDPNRLRGKALREALDKKWDLYALGKTLFRLLAILEERKIAVLRPYTRRYLRLMACRLLDGHNQASERAMGLALVTVKEIKYATMSEVVTDFQKLLGSFNLTRRIPELDPHIQENIQISSRCPTPFTNRVRCLVTHPDITRLDNVTQLGLVNYIYPTAIHTRYVHSLGAFSIVAKIIVALYHDPLNPLFRQIMTEGDLCAALLAALLHDLGQYPLAHDLEEADMQTFSHEVLTATLLDSKQSLIAGIIRRDWNVEPSLIAAVLNARPATLRGTLKQRVLHSLIDGPIDADKLDYLVRDSEECRLEFGHGLDIDRLLKGLTIVFRQQGDQTYAALGIHEKGKILAEDVAWVRYKMFGQVYWHHTYRAIKAMMHRATWEALERTKPARFKQEFLRFVVPRQSFEAQSSLFAPQVTTPQIIDKPNNAHFADVEVLTYISEASSAVGKSLIDGIKKRVLFKRLLVVAHDRTPDKHLWDKISQFYRNNANRWERKLKLQREYQLKLVGMIESPQEPLPSSTFLTVTAKNAFLVAGRTECVILIDFPPEKGGSATALEYVIEEERRRYKSDELETGTLEQSVIWNSLNDKFHESIGKLRIFAHPLHDDFLRHALARSALEGALLEVIDAVESEEP
jgi:HD superfamily phosphohydrolase